MNLSISPELDARICYIVVLCCGVVAARVQISRRLQVRKVTGIWVEPGTWLMFLIYLAAPLALFWLMDRSGAISDTALFAAILIGASYPAILSGSFGGLRAPEGLVEIWKPIDSLADVVTTWITRRAERDSRSLESWIVSRMVADPAAMTAILQLARAVPTSDALDADLAQIDRTTLLQNGVVEPFPNPLPPAAQAFLQTATHIEKRAKRIYLYASSMSDFEQTIWSRGIIRDKLFLLKSPLYRGRIITTAIVIAALALVVTGIYGLRKPEVCLAYDAWRLEKQNTSAIDLSRTKDHLRGYLSGKTLARCAADQLRQTLRTPGLPTDRIDAVLDVFLESRSSLASNNISLPDLLVNALRTPSADSRSHIHHALVFLAGDQDPSFSEKDLIDWNPNKGNSTTELEKKINAWTRYWGHVEKTAVKSP
jgi:hypothetical protein